MTGQCPGSLTYAFKQLEQISARPFGNVLRIYLRMGRHHILQSLGRGEKEVKLQSRGWKVGSRNVVDRGTDSGSRKNAKPMTMLMVSRTISIPPSALVTDTSIPLTSFACLHEGCYTIRQDFFFSTPTFQADTSILGQLRVFYIDPSPRPNRTIQHGKRQGRQGWLPAQGAQGY